MTARSLQHVTKAGRETERVGQHPHFQGAICSTGEDAIAGRHFDLHDSGAEVSKEGLLGVLVFEGVDQTVARQPPHLE